MLISPNLCPSVVYSVSCIFVALSLVLPEYCDFKSVNAVPLTPGLTNNGLCVWILHQFYCYFLQHQQMEY